jgi:bifunctional non-homologous end joining protein LigD
LKAATANATSRPGPHFIITPSAPVLKREPPTGREWLHEVKHDGWRAQLHKAGDVVTIYSRNGNDVTQRFKSVAEAVAKLPAHSVIMDAEIIACDADGVPDFYALMHRAPHGCCAYCFDLLELDGTACDMMGLVERRYPLRRLLKRGESRSCGTTGIDPAKIPAG